jgi:putative transposase
MTRPYSMDLRERVVAAVERDGLSRNQAAARYGIAESTAYHWLRRYHATGDVKPSKIGGYRKKALRDEHAAWLIARCREREFTISQLVEELRLERGLKVDRHTVWDFLHAEGLSFKKKPVRQGAGSSGRRQAA